MVKFRDSIQLFGFKIEHLIEILEFILGNSYVKAEDNYFLQLKGVGTGYNTSPPYSEIIIDWTYSKALETIIIDPLGLSLYVDDCWLGWLGSLESFMEFKVTLNSVWPGELVFTHEVENKEKSINFLDMTITRCTTRLLEYEFYQNLHM